MSTHVSTIDELIKLRIEGSTDDGDWEVLLNKLKIEVDFDSFIQTTKEAINSIPLSSVPHRILATAFHGRGEFLKALAHFELAIEKSHNQMAWFYIMGSDIRVRCGQFQAAIELLRGARPRFPNEFALTLKLLELLSIAREAEQTKRLLNMILSDHSRSISEKISATRLSVFALDTDIILEQLNLQKWYLAFSPSERASFLAPSKDFDLTSDLEFMKFEKSSLRSAEWWISVRNIGEIIRHLDIRRVVIWGFRFPKDHTHHWIHRAFYRAFVQLQRVGDLPIEVLWCDVSTSYVLPTKGRSLFLSACGYCGQLGFADQGIPIVTSDYYLIHQSGFARAELYSELLSRDHCVFFDEYRVSFGDSKTSFERVIEDKKTVVFPWATDLLPWEIVDGMTSVASCERKRHTYHNVAFIGSIWRQNAAELMELLEVCAKRGMILTQRGNFVESDYLDKTEQFSRYRRFLQLDTRPASLTDNVRSTRLAKMAPSIQGADQIGTYVSDRVLKNCSYGALGMSNNYLASRLLGDVIFYHNDIENLIEKALSAPMEIKIEMILESMGLVAKRHTYLNRIFKLISMLRK